MSRDVNNPKKSSISLRYVIGNPKSPLLQYVLRFIEERSNRAKLGLGLIPLAPKRVTEVNG